MILRALLILLVICTAACSGERQNHQQKDPADSAGRAADTSGSQVPETSKGKSPTDSLKLIWQGVSDNYTIFWDGKDIAASAPGKGAARFSMHDLLEHRWRMAFKSEDAPAGCSSEYSMKILSVVGSLISVELSEYGQCPGAAHPNVTTSYESVVLANPDRPIALTHYFDEKDIYQALINDGIVKKVLAAENIATPATLPQLIYALGSVSGFCEYGFTDDLLTRFAFHHLEEDKVAVRLGVSHGSGACRGMLTQLGILLPIPEHLLNALKRADAREEGFLMKDAESIAGNRNTLMKVE